jgi:L-2-hydroxyglutarate oxidase
MGGMKTLPRTDSDVLIVGGGIVGLATAMRLTELSARKIVVIEAENIIAAHQTGHNSGVIHSGIYYRPGSLKAENCSRGRESLYKFCEEHDIPHERCGKLIVATCDAEIPALRELLRRGEANGLAGICWLEGEAIRKYEPHARGVAALFVPQTGIVDYKQVAAAYARLFQERGGELKTSSRFLKLTRSGAALVVTTNNGEERTRFLVNCAGLQSDRVARKCGINPGVRIVPFRGDYYLLTAAASAKVKNLIYPVPNPDLPFLGVHLTRMIDGRIEAGPNAVLAFKREGYRRTSFSIGDTWETFSYRGFYPMAKRFWRVGFHEMARAFSPQLFAEAVSRLLPGIKKADLIPGGAGVRAQAVDKSGKLVDDFCMIERPGMLHVLNAPSPAATASLSIADTIAKKVLNTFV